MKQICCICLSVLLLLGICGCDSANIGTTGTQASLPSNATSSVPPTSSGGGEIHDPSTTIPPLSQFEMDIIYPDSNDDYIYGEIIDKMFSNVLVLEPGTPRMESTWGKVVYILTDEADKWCVGDSIDVKFSMAERPHDTTQPVRIHADSVWPLLLGAKPIIYLYPEMPTVCSVKLNLDGDLTSTYPAHGVDGWQNFTAYPDGTLIFPDGQEYYALYWEGIQNTRWDFSQGWCVPGENTAAFLEWALAKLGLTRREANEFIVYWLPLMQNNAYNVISFQTAAYTDTAVLEINPAPDSMLRVFMAYYPTETEVELQPQTLEGFVRQGFTVIEWGGSQVSKP